MIIPSDLKKFIEIEPETGTPVFFDVHHDIPSPFKLSKNPDTRYSGFLCAYVIIPRGKSAKDDFKMEFKCPERITFGYVECCQSEPDSEKYDYFYPNDDYIPSWGDVRISDKYRVVGWDYDLLSYEEYTVEQAVNDSLEAARYLAKNRPRRSD